MSDGLPLLIDRLDAAVKLGDPQQITVRIKQELEDAIHARSVALPERFRLGRPSPIDHGDELGLIV